MRFCLTFLSVCVLVCISVFAEDKTKGEAQDVEYCQLARNPLSFSGKRIRVRAIYVYDSEVRLLEPPTCCMEAGPKIWARIVELDDHSGKLFRKKLDKGMGVALVVFVGKFESGFAGSLGAKFRMTVEKIDKVERSAKSSGQSPRPSWAQRCQPRVAQP
jgi:hypothetical protein